MKKKRERERSELSSSEIADLWEHACLLYHSYEWQGAANAFSELEHYTSDPVEKCIFVLNKGLIEARLGDFELALHSFTTALVFEEDNPVAYFFLGLVHAETGDYERAQAHLEQCLERLGTCSQNYQTNFGPFDLDRRTVVDNINRLRSVKVATAADFGQFSPTSIYLQTIPADIIFEAPSRSGNTSQTQFSTKLTSDAELHRGFDGHLRDPVSSALQPIEIAGRDISSLHLVEDANMNLAVASSTTGLEQGRRNKRLLPRDAQVRDGSSRELARFLRHAGPGGNANVTVDRKYMQRLLQGNTGNVNALDFLGRASTASDATPIPIAPSHQLDDIESLLALYAETPAKRHSIPSTIDSSTSEATVTLRPDNPQYPTSNRVDLNVDRERPTQSRRPTLETAQRWLRKEVRAPWPYKLATSDQKSHTRPARDRSHGASSLIEERDRQSLPSVVSSTEMFTFGRPGGKGRE